MKDEIEWKRVDWGRRGESLNKVTTKDYAQTALK
jgi:hypothetical protein